MKSNFEYDLLQGRLDARSAVLIHKYFIHRINCRLVLSDLMSLVVPLLFWSMELALSGCSYLKSIVTGMSYIASAVLVTLVLYCLIDKSRERLSKHHALLQRNMEMINDINTALNGVNISSKEKEDIIKKITDLDIDDARLVPKIEDEKRKKFYRDALKEDMGESAICPICKKSPWKFKPGECAQCGNSDS